MNLSYRELREQLVQAAHRLDQAGVMSHSGHGNMSVRLPETGHMLLTSVGQITHLTPEQLVVVTFDGEVVANLERRHDKRIGLDAAWNRVPRRRVLQGRGHGEGRLVQPGCTVDGRRREVREEAGLECELVRLRGTISWPGFGKNDEAWFGFIFCVDRWSGEPLKENAEGTLEWVELNSISQLPLWEGDRFFLPLVFENTERQFHGVMPYEHGRPVLWRFDWL